MAEEVAETWFEMGQNAETYSDFERDLRLYYQALAKDPDNIDALLNVGVIEHNQGNFQAAERNYRKILAINAHHAQAHYNLANCFSQKNPPEPLQAIDHFLKALTTKPDFGDAHYNLAVEYRNLGQCRNALKHFRLFLKNCGTNDDCFKRYALEQIYILEHQDLRLVVPAKNNLAQMPTPDIQTG